jgi:hypothetical protein
MEGNSAREGSRKKLLLLKIPYILLDQNIGAAIVRINRI